MELVQKANQGDETAFHALYDKYLEWTLKTAWRFTHDSELSQDIAQEVFIQLLNKFPGFELTARMTTYLYTVTYHTSINMQRKARRLKPLEHLPERIDHQDPLNEIHDPKDTFALIMKKLSVEHRQTLILRFVEDMELKEIAEIMKVPVGTVKSRMHHALNKLKNDPMAMKYFLDSQGNE